MLDHPLVRKADAYASLAHLGQWRVTTLGPACAVPFIAHLRGIARLLAEDHPHPLGRDPVVLQVALLHASLWRGAGEPDQLERAFGRNVAAGVRMLSPWLRGRPQTWADADAYWRRLPRAPLGLRVVVGAAWLDHLDVARRWPQAFDLATLAATVRTRVLPLVADDILLPVLLDEALEGLVARAAEAAEAAIAVAPDMVAQR